MASPPAPVPKPRPTPRPRNQTKAAKIAENENGKPVVAPSLPTKPVVPPKPRRQPSTDPRMEKSNCTQTSNNEVIFNKTTTVTKQTAEERSCGSVKANCHVNATESVDGISNGPERVDVRITTTTAISEDHRYEPLRPQTESASSNSDDGYEDIIIPPKRKEVPAPAPRADKPSPPLPRKIHGGSGKPLLPPVHSKTVSPESKTSPPLFHKFSGSPPLLPKSTTKRPEESLAPNFNSSNTDGTTLDLNPGDGKPKPLAPKKPLPPLPKGVAPSSIEAVSSKPPIPVKPPSVSAEPSQTSVAALAKKLSTMPLFAYRDSEASNEGSSLNVPSAHGSRLPSPASSGKALPQGRKLSPNVGSPTKSSELTSLKVLPKPGNLKSERSQSQTIPLDPRHETQKPPPARPSPSSSEALSRVHSKTMESLEDEESQQMDRTSLMSKGFRAKSSHPERHKRKLGSRHKSLQTGPALASTQSGQTPRRAPPLPPGFPLVTSLRPPPVPIGPRPRPSSAYEDATRTHAKTVGNKSVSVGDLPRVMTAEEQSEYSYAYEHTFLGPSAPSRVPSVCNTPPVVGNQSADTYVEPKESVVNEFVENIQKKNMPRAYEDADQQNVTIESWSKTQTLSGFPAEIMQSSDEEDSESSRDTHEYWEPPVNSDEDGDNRDDDASSENSFSSDSSDGYTVPPENISPPEPPPHSNTYDLCEGIYMEPFQKSSEEVFSSDDDKGSISSEPLYQVYNARTLERERNLSRRRLGSDLSSNDEALLEELTKGTLRNMRMLWCELPEVKASGILDLITPKERKRQEAMFEVITSEASYLKSLNVLILHFLNSEELSAGSSLCTLERGQSHVLFSNVSSIKSVSESFLQALRARQKEAVVMSSISDIIEEHASKQFEVYVKYCSNQIYQDRALRDLRKNMRFIEAVVKLEGNKKAQGLTLQSFLVLPMQRITRLPLLVNAICHQCEPGSDEFHSTDQALAAINKIVHECNEGARKMERMEEMCLLQTQIEFKTKPLALATSTRYLLRRGDLMHVVEDSRSPLKRGKPKLKPLYMFLFNDLLLLTKKKSENRFQAIDYATRNMTQLEEPREPELNLEHMISLVLLENSDGKTKEFLLLGNSETDKTRWIEAFKPPAAEQEGETVYGSWDCPQVHALHSYTARQPDELSLFEGDVINVLKKLRDGWYHGERLCDGTQGWFPANHTEEILNEHVRARNLRQRYRLLAASKHLIGGTLRL